jgi:acetyl esterase/lipase
MIPGPAGEQMIRIYRPKGSTSALPGLINVHGGGMILGSVEGDAATAQMLAVESGAIVVSVDYRKAPEDPYPAALNDCYSASQWVFDNAKDLGIDPDNIGIYGGSAGGGLILGVCLMARDRGSMTFKYMMPIYPMIDDRNETASTHDVTEVGIWDRSGTLRRGDCIWAASPLTGTQRPLGQKTCRAFPLPSSMWEKWMRSAMRTRRSLCGLRRAEYPVNSAFTLAPITPRKYLPLKRHYLSASGRDALTR